MAAQQLNALQMINYIYIKILLTVFIKAQRVRIAGQCIRS